MQKQNIFIETWEFIKESKAWWLIPIITMIFIIGFVFIIGQSSGVAPFLYILF